MKKTAVVILNWNGKGFLERFLGNLVTNTPQDLAEIIIIDNASSDDSTGWLRKNFPEIRTIQLDQNYGFAGGYNKGLAQIKAEHFLLLNSDIEVPENWLQPLIKLMDKDNSIGICGPKLLSWHERNKFEYAGASGGFIDTFAYPFCRGRLFDTCETDQGQYNDILDCFWISGAALMIRSELFFTAGGFDEKFFAHQEEIDLCWRVQNLGYRVVIQPQSEVYHIGGGTLPKSSPFKTFLNFRNNLFLIEKNIPRYKRNRVKFFRIFLDQIAFYKILLSGNIKEAFSIPRAYWHFWSHSNSMSKQRKAIKPKSLKYLKGYYNRSIVFDYYIRGKKKFTDLKF